jgi:preprotein translocase subunit YajC
VPTTIHFLLAEGGQSGLMDLLFPLAIVFLIFYFLVIRPASRDRRKREDQIKSIKKNDRVVTNAGIHGTVTGLDEQTVTVRVDDKTNTRIKFSRAAIWQVGPPGQSAEGGMPS